MHTLREGEGGGGGHASLNSVVYDVRVGKLARWKSSTRSLMNSFLCKLLSCQ